MQEKNDYVITQGTMVLFTHYENGETFTKVIDRNGQFLVRKKPYELMDDSLKHYGTSLKGARDGAKRILGNVLMCPVLMSEKLELYWFYTRSYNHPDCTWISLQHVESHMRKDSKSTIVTLKNKIAIELDISLQRFDRKLQRAYLLKGKIDERVKPSSNVIEKVMPCLAYKPDGQLNYEFEQLS